jgi:hypothetical protein
MNARATELGLTNTTYVDPFGGSKTFGPDVTRNTSTARDQALVGKEVFKASHTALRAIAGTASHGVAVTGPSARTITMTNFSRFVNGPTATQAGISDPTVVASKNGIWIQSGSGIFQYNMVTLWTAPSGREIVIATFGSQSLFAAMLDQRGLMFSLPRDFPYLRDTATPTDPNFSAVQLLIGADAGSIVDESSAGRTVTTSGATTGSPVNNTVGAVVLGTSSQYITVADASAVSVAGGDMTIETWYAGDGTEPGGEGILFAKWNHSTGQREWLVEHGGAGGIDLYASADGSGAFSANVLSSGGGVGGTFFNGAPRHIALVKHGSTLTVYFDGEAMANTLSVATIFNGNAPISLGYPVISSVGAPGHYDDFRCTFTVARYTAAFVPITSRKFPRS